MENFLKNILKGENGILSHEKGIEKIFELLINAPVAIMVLDINNFEIKLVNAQQLNIWNKEENEVIGKSLFKTFPEFNEKFEKPLNYVKETGKSFEGHEVETRFIIDNKIYQKWFNFLYQPVFDINENVKFIISTSVDITDQVVLKKKAEENYRSLLHLANALPQLVWIANPDGQVTFYNEQSRHYQGLEKKNNGTWDWKVILHEEDRQPTIDTWLNAVNKKSIYEKEHRILMKDGSYRWHLSRGIPSKDREGNVIQWFGTATDIHDVKVAEENIKISERRFRSLAENSPDIITRHGKDYKYLYVNPQLEKITGIPAENFLNKTYREAGLHESLCIQFDHYLKNVFENKKQLSVEFEVPDTDNYIQSRMVPEFDSSGEIESVLVLSYDISESKKREEKLNYGNTLLESITDAVLSVDRNWNINSWNNAATELYGYTEEEVIGKPASEIVRTKAINNELPDIRQKLIQNGKWRGEVVHYSKDGRELYIEASATAIRDEEGNIIGVVSVNRNKTKEIESEQKVKESENRFREIADNAPAYIFIAAENAEVEYMNKTWSSFTGYSSESFKGKGWLNVTHPDDIDMIMSVYKESFEKQIPFSFESRSKSADGNYHWIYWKGVPRYISPDKIAGMMGIGIDITERKNTESALQRSEEKYRSLFESMDQGFSIMEMIYDDHGNTINYKFVECNKVFDEQTGLVNAQGKEVLELVPNLEKKWFDYYGKVAKTREPIRFIDGSEAMGRWFEVFAFHIGPHDSQQVAVLFTDITERKKFEEKIKEGAERLQAALNASNTGTFRWNMGTNELFFDDNLNKLFGLPEGKTFNRLNDFINSIFESDRDKIYKAIDRCVKYGDPFDEEFRVIWPDGSIHWLDDKGKTYRDENGKPLYMTGACLDITKKKLSEESLNNTLAQLESLLVNAPVGFAFFDSQHRYLRVNQTLADINGIPIEDHIGKPIEEILPVNAKFVAPVIDEIISTKKPILNLEVTGETPKEPGKKRDWLTGFYPVMDAESNEVGIIGVVVTEITDRKKAEQEIKESEERFRTLANSIPQIVWTLDSNGVMTYINEQWTRYTGQSIEEAMIGVDTMIHPDDFLQVSSQWKKAMKDGVSHKFDYRLYNEEKKSYRWFTSLIVPVKNSEGIIVKWIGASTDIHDQKTLSQKLEKLVSERTKELQRSNDDLQQFAHVASHDLKEPVRKIKIFSNRLEKEVSNSIKGAEFLSKIQSAADRMTQMIDGVLAYSQIDAQKNSAEIIDLNAIIDSIETDLELPIKNKNGKIITSSLPKIEGADVLIYQLFFNLINNSLKFSDSDNPLIININSRSVKYRNADAVEITIEDNGIGFPQSFSEHIFETFARLHSKDKYEGTGLGLALCKKIVERHNGKIEAKGEEGKGALFYVTLPLKQE